MSSWHLLFFINKYFKKENDSIKLVYNKSYPSESLSNLALTGSPTDHKITVDLKIKGYGNEDKPISMPLNKFLGHFDTHFKIYFGIEDAAADHLRGTLIIYNSVLNYLHLLDIRSDVISLFGDPGKLVGTFYPYIPTHNIKELFNIMEGSQSIISDNLLKQDIHE